MSDSTIFQDAWSGWKNFGREVVVHKKAPGPDLKVRPKRPNKVPLKRDLKKVRRPQPKRTKPAIREEKRLLRREEPEDVPKLAVDPPKPFKLAEEFLETPPERLSRVEKEQLAKKKPLRKKVAAWLQESQTAPTLFEGWYGHEPGLAPTLFDGGGVARGGRAFRRAPAV